MQAFEGMQRNRGDLQRKREELCSSVGWCRASGVATNAHPNPRMKRRPACLASRCQVAATISSQFPILHSIRVTRLPACASLATGQRARLNQPLRLSEPTADARAGPAGPCRADSRVQDPEPCLKPRFVRALLAGVVLCSLLAKLYSRPCRPRGHCTNCYSSGGYP